MSTTVDSRVVEMRFDNKQFESNVQTSMSTLDKLKQKLNLNGAAKGLDSLDKAAKKVDFSGMGKGIETVNAKFSAMQVVGMTALSNITNSAIRAGERIVKALSIDQVTDGFREYETKINAIQVIKANTRGKNSMDEIKASLEELNDYADKTIYNFAQMTSNAGKFTAQGFDVQTATNAIKGLANLAAASGASAEDMSRATYQMSQALSSSIKLMDWNSLRNANMATVELKNTLIDLARVHGVAIDDMIEKEGSFEQTLSSGWLTGEMFTEAMNIYSGVYSDAELKAKGFTDSQIKNFKDLAKEAESAATEVKTFTQLMGTVKEAIGSGWARTWELIIGDFDEAKDVFTGISNFLTGEDGIFTKMSDARNSLLESALGKSFSGLSEKLSKAFEPIDKVSAVVSDAKKAIEDLGTVVDDVIIGKFGNGRDRFDALTKAGQNYYRVQNKVNEKLGSSKRYTQEQIDAQDKLLGKQKETVSATSETSSATSKLTVEQKKLIKEQYELYKAKDTDIQFTEDQIEAYKELENTASQLGLSVEDLVDNMDDINGRWLLINSFKNIGQSIITIFQSIGKAWQDVFEPLQSDQLFNGLTSFHKISATVFNSIKANADELTATFRGLFSAIHIITSLVGGGFKLAFQVLSSVLGNFDMNILDLTAGIGNAITRLDQFITKNKLLSDAIDFIANAITKAIDAIDNFVESLVNQPAVQEFVNTMKELFGGLFSDVEGEDSKNLAGGLHEMKGALDETSGAAENFKTIFEGLNAVLDLGNYFITASLSSGIKLLNSILTLFGTNLAEILSLMAEYVIQLRDWVKENTIFIGMHDKIAKVLKAIIDGISKVVDAFMELDVVQEIIQRFKDLITDLFGSFEDGLDLSFIDKVVANIESAFDRISKWVSSLQNSDNLGRDIVLGLANGIREGIGIVISSIASVATAVIETFCSILGIHSPSTVAFGWGKNIVEGLVNGLKAFAGLITGGIGFIADTIIDAFSKIDIDFSAVLEPIQEGLMKFIDLVQGFDFTRLLALIPIGIVLMFAKKVYDVAKILADGVESINSVISSFAKLGSSLAGVADAYAKNIKAKAFRNIAISLAILIGAVSLLTFVDQDKLFSSVIVVGILAGILVALAKAMDKMSSASGSFDKGKINFEGIKTGLIQIGATLLLLAAAVRLIGTMNPEQAIQGFEGLAGLVIAVSAVFLAYGILAKNAKAAKNLNKVGSMLLKLSISLFILVGVCKLISSMSWPDMGKAIVFMSGFTIFVGALVKVTTIGKKQKTAKISGLLLSISVALTMMVGVVKLISLLKPGELIKGAAFLAGFTVFVGALVTITTIDKGQSIAKIGGLLLSISVALTLMVGVCKLVGSLSAGEIVKGIGFVTAFGLLLTAFTMIAKIGGSTVVKATATILAFSIGIGILSGIAVLLSMMPVDGLVKGVAAVTMLGAVMTAMVWATRGANDVKGNLTVMAAAIAVMAGSISVLSLIDTSKLAGATAALSTVMGMFALMTKAVGSGSSSTKTIIMLGVMAAVIAELAFVLDKIQGLPIGSTLANAAALSTLLLALSASLEVLDGTRGLSAKAYISVGVITAVVGALAGILYLVQGLPTASTMSTAASLSVLLLALSSSLEILDGVGRISNNAMKSVAVLSVITGLLGLALTGISKLKPGPTLEIAASISTVLLAMSSAALILSKISPLASAALPGAAGMLAIIGVVSAILIGIAGIIGQFDAAKKFVSDAIPVLEMIGEGLGSLIGGFVGGIGEGMSGALPQIGQDIADFMDKLATASEKASGIKSGSFSGVQELISALGGIALTTVGSSISDFFTIGGSSMERFQNDGVAFFEAMAAISEASAGVSVNEESMNSVIGVAQKLSDLQSSIEPMGGVMDFFAGRDDLGAFGGNVGLFIKGMSTAFAELNNANVSNGTMEKMTMVTSAATELSKLQSSVEDMGGVIDFFKGRDDLGAFGGNVALFIQGMSTAFSTVEESSSVNSGSMLKLNMIISASTELSKLQSSVEDMGGVIDFFKGRDDLGAFGSNIASFVLSMNVAFRSLEQSSVNMGTMLKLGMITSAATELSKLQSTLEEIDGVIDYFAGHDDLGTFGDNVADFAKSMAEACGSLEGQSFDEAAFESVINAAKKLAEFQSSLEPMEDVFDWFTGREDLGTFGENVGQFAEAMGKLKSGIGDGGISDDAISSITKTGNALVSLIEVLPEEGFFDGKMDLSKFSDYVARFGAAMGSFGTNVADINTDSINVAITAANRIRYLIESLSDLDTSGVAAFTGVGVGGFGADGAVTSIAKAISAYCSEVAGIDIGVLSSSVASANKLKGLIAGLAGLDTSGIENFKVTSIGQSMKDYSNKVKDIDAGLVASSIASANKLKGLIAGLAGLDTSGIANFQIAPIGQTLHSYSVSISGFDAGAVSASISAASKLKSFIASLSGLDASGVGSFISAVNQLGTVSVDNIVKSFSGASSKMLNSGSNLIAAVSKGMQSKGSLLISTANNLTSSMQKAIASKASAFQNAGSTLMVKLCAGIRSKSSSVSSTLRSSLASAASSIRSYYGSFYSAGSYLGSGLVIGINSQQSAAYSAGYRLGQAAVRGEKDGQASNSPSKLTIQAGKWLGEGLVIGINKMGTKVYNAGHNLGDNAAASMSNSISKIAEAINTDIDAQPTIRPVLDLEEIKSGAGAIGSLLGQDAVIGYNANVGAISSLRNQNGARTEIGDVVTAINRLRKDLGNVSNTSYNINGVQYSEGSEVANAMETIVRALILERRT